MTHMQIQQDFPEMGVVWGVVVQGEGHHILLNILKNLVLLATVTTGLIFARQSKQRVATLCFDGNYTYS